MSDFEFDSNNVPIYQIDGANKKSSKELYAAINKYGALLVRGKLIQNPDDFRNIITQEFKLEPWYKVTVPAFILNYFRSLLATNDYRKHVTAKLMQLGVPEKSIQGPHTETGQDVIRGKYLAMYCKNVSADDAPTAIYDLVTAYKNLPKELQEKYLHCYNQFSMPTRKLNWWQKIFVKIVAKNVGTLTFNADNSAIIKYPKAPMVVRHPKTNELCIQPWAFAKNTARAVHEAALKVFLDRDLQHMDKTASEGKIIWDLVDKDGNQVDFSQEEQLVLFETILKTNKLHKWQKNEVLIVDNIKTGHGRMDGPESDRCIMQYQCSPFLSTDISA